MKLVALLSDRETPLGVAARHTTLRSERTNAILAEPNGAAAKPESNPGVALVWPDDPEVAATEAALARCTRSVHRMREVVHWDELGAPGRGAVVLVYSVKRRADYSFDAFAEHYQQRHAPLARIHHPGIARYVQNFVTTPADDAPFDAISELWFASESDARTRFYRDDESRRVIAEDVRRFIDLKRGGAFAARVAG